MFDADYSDLSDRVRLKYFSVKTIQDDAVDTPVEWASVITTLCLGGAPSRSPPHVLVSAQSWGGLMRAAQPLFSRGHLLVLAAPPAPD